MRASRIFSKTIIRILIILVACIIALAATEFIFKKSQYFKELHNKIIADPEPCVVTMNEQGFRVISKDVIYEKNCGEYLRIICLGDSFTLGGGVNDDKTYPFFLESHLERMYQRRVQVINAGVSGVTITRELKAYKKRCIPLEHNLVILLFHRTDLFELAKELLFKRDGSEESTTVDEYLQRNSRIYSLLQFKIAQQRSRYAQRYSDEHRKDIINKYCETLWELNKTVQSRNAVLIVVIFESVEHLDYLKDFCTNEGIPIIDVRQEYAQRCEKDDIFLVWHHNEIGNEFLAKIIAHSLSDVLSLKNNKINNKSKISLGH